MKILAANDFLPLIIVVSVLAFFGAMILIIILVKRHFTSLQIKKDDLTEEEVIKIREVIDKEYNDSWFLVIDDKDRNYLLKTRHGLEYSIVAMSKYKGKYEFYKISTDLIKIYGNKIYPIVFKLVVL